MTELLIEKINEKNTSKAVTSKKEPKKIDLEDKKKPTKMKAKDKKDLSSKKTAKSSSKKVNKK